MLSATYLHKGTVYEVDKRVNAGPWMHYTSGHPTRETAEESIRRGNAIHSERCPNDRVEWAIQQIH